MVTSNSPLLTEPAILLLDKPKGLSSQQATTKAKRLFNIKKAGHTGSLDPLATGLLPICFGEATKFSQFLLGAQKHYQVTGQLGIHTDTGDQEGRELSRHLVPSFTKIKLLETLSQFQGNILQTPPMFSALKHQGKPLYYWAQQGITIPRQARPVTIDMIKLISYQDTQLKLEIKCSKGTYIRSLIEDIGKALGCGSAHVTALRRISVGHYTEIQSVPFHTIESISSLQERNKLLLPLTTVFLGWVELKISNAAAFYLRRGQALALPSSPTHGWVCLRLKTNYQFIGLGQILSDGRVAPYRLINAE